MRQIREFFIVLLACLAFGGSAQAEQADVDAASRGVVRVVIIATDGTRAAIIGHGTGFAVTANKILTNAHVVARAARSDFIGVGVIRAEGDDRWPARIVGFSPRNDLALLELVDEGRLPALTLFTGPVETGADVHAVGYPGSVDRARGLSDIDLIEPTTPVSTRGTLSGGSSAKAFDTILHTAAMGSGNSGGPLLDDCGRVLGVNSFGAETRGVDSEFYFSVSMREVMRFLNRAKVQAKTTGSPCRSIAELEKIEADKQAAMAAQQQEQEKRAEEEERRAEDDARLEIISERENGMALAGLALVLSLLSGGAAIVLSQKDGRRNVAIAAGVVAVALMGGAVFAWVSRPSLGEAGQRARAILGQAEGPDATATSPAPLVGKLVCVLDIENSRITVSSGDDVPFTWTQEGCVNDRTQYALGDDGWQRVLVPDQDQVVTVASYDPDSRIYRTERFLLDLETMERMRERRTGMTAPSCGDGLDAARTFGDEQARLSALLPTSPNERLVYNCKGRP